MQRCVAFLTDELKVCGREEAMERVFFVSAREVLTIRAKALNNGTPPGSAPNIGTPSIGGTFNLLNSVYKCYQPRGIIFHPLFFWVSLLLVGFVLKIIAMLAFQ